MRMMAWNTVRTVAILGLVALVGTQAMSQKTTQVTLMTAGDGSAFLP